ncbi:guanylate kinase [Campylobacterota bacterium]|nr:guanylate kinase [Campylobacterota bacterium]
MSGSLLVVSGPSGSGKSSLCRKICDTYDYAALSISTTTRALRASEKEGVDYLFTTKEAFEKAIEQGEFLEWAEVHGNFYGTSKRWVVDMLSKGKTVVFDIDVQGQAAIAKLFSDRLTSVFVTTPSLEILKDRLVKRATDNAETIERRLKNALDEMAQIDYFDYLVINDRFDESYETLKAIVLASRVKRSKVSLCDFISAWKA